MHLLDELTKEGSDRRKVKNSNNYGLQAIHNFKAAHEERIKNYELIHKNY
jgi:hypothetical protein